MIVTEERVEVAIEYLNIDPHPLALARKYLTDAENKSEEVFARAYLEAKGSIPERESIATCSPDYMEAKEQEAEYMLDLERHKAKVRGAEMIIEIYRTESANTRIVTR